jgi:phosphopantothenoylcysteine decarboxylase/phosphopantothenate--cysteine ligase
MGVAIAEAAQKRGAEMTLITGNVSVSIPKGVKNISALTTPAMLEAVMAELPAADYIIKAAAPCDYVISRPSADKIKADKITLEFQKTADIAAAVGKNKGKTKLIIFCAEKTDLIARAKEKMTAKNADMVIANNIAADGAGFGSDTNIITIISKNSEWQSDCLKKTALADIILDKISKL